MKVGIITLYDTLNNGAFLQAYGLQKQIEKMGHEVEFINFNNKEDTYKKIRTVISKNPKKLIFNIKKFYNFKSAWTRLNISEEKYLKVQKKYDVVIIGSDEMWNLTNGDFTHLPLFFGKNINANIVATYAVSCGQATKKDIIESDISGIKNINFLAARDKNTFNIMTELTQKNVELVLDPTLISDYKEEEIEMDNEDYILIYTGGLDEVNIQKVKDFATEKKLKLISASFYNDWCDEIIADGPFKFLSLVNKAKYIITDTFHGTLFSIIYKKNFMVLTESKIKVSSILNDFKLDERIVRKDMSLREVSDKKIDYKEVYKIIEEKKKLSIEYLNQVLSY